MTKTVTFLACMIFLSAPSLAQIAPKATSDQQALLASSNPELAKNKQIVYDFWRVVFEGCHLKRADEYLSESYIQHNPTVPTGRAGFVKFLSQYCKPHTIASTIKAPLISIVAERDMVVLSFAKVHRDPKDPTKTYTTTWFDMFRLNDGKIVEHWDPALKR